ncbi:MAG TPA: carbon-nitrogen hydrolase family protein [Eubacteriales bacterium]|nr:carbon-nitrogen hydrolase family protein [Eubacteriales bacterium]
MARQVRIAAVSRIKQPVPLPREAYIAHCIRQAEEAGRAGCDVCLLPEHFDSFGAAECEPDDGGIYDGTTDRRALYRAVAEEIPGPMTERFGRVCREYGMYVIADYAERSGETFYNTAVIIGRDGEVAGRYRKTHLCASEKRCYGVDAGDELPVFDLDFGRIGIAICMDMYFPEVFRVLTLKGAEMIFWPHQTYGPSEETILITARARAIDYCCYLVGANFASPGYYAPYERGHEFTGRAVVINPDGVILADTGHYPGAALADIDLDTPRLGKDIAAARRDGVDRIREDLLRFRRPELYKEIVRSCDNEAVRSGKFLD